MVLCRGIHKGYRRGDPAQVRARKERISMLRLQGEAGVRQAQGVGEAGTRQREWSEKRPGSQRSQITGERKAISMVRAQRAS